MKEDNHQSEQRRIQEYFKNISKYSNFKLKLLQEDISKEELFDITNFKVKYQLLQLGNFQDEKLQNKLIAISERIIDL